MILCLLMLLSTLSRLVVFFLALPRRLLPGVLLCCGVPNPPLGAGESSSKSNPSSFSSSLGATSLSTGCATSSPCGLGALLPGHFQSSSSQPGPLSSSVYSLSTVAGSGVQ